MGLVTSGTSSIRRTEKAGEPVKQPVPRPSNPGAGPRHPPCRQTDIRFRLLRREAHVLDPNLIQTHRSHSRGSVMIPAPPLGTPIFTFEATVKIVCSKRLRAAEAGRCAEQWKVRLIQNLIDSEVIEKFTDIMRIGRAIPLPGRDGPVIERQFAGCDQEVSIRTEDSPGSVQQPLSHPVPGGVTPLEWMSTKDEFLNWLIVENIVTGERRWLYWVHWEASWRVWFDPASDPIRAQRDSHMWDFGIHDQGPGPGPQDPVFQPFKIRLSEYSLH